MTLTMDLQQDAQALLARAAREHGVAPDEWARRVLMAQLRPRPPVDADADGRRSRAVALLQSWMRAGVTDDQAEIQEAEKEVEELKRNLNANRLATRERLVFPE